MSFKQLKFNSEDYRQVLVLRNDYLWKPLGLNLLKQDLSEEESDFHFAWELDEKIVASAIITGRGDVVKLRQMVVHPDFQGRKIGKKLLCKIEDFMISKGSARIELHSQIPAKGFYGNLGYKETGEEFIEAGIPHQKMFRNLLCSTC